MKYIIQPYDFVIDNSNGWRGLEESGASTEKGLLQLEPAESSRIKLTDESLTFGGHVLPRGVATRFNEIFIADPQRHRILRWQLCCGPTIPLSTIGGFGNEPRQFHTPMGLAISHRGDLVVADSGNRRLLLFTLPGLALRRIIGPFRTKSKTGANKASEIPATSEKDPCMLQQEPIKIPALWRPVDVAAGPGGTLYVADATGLIWRLDSQGRPDANYSGHLPSEVQPCRVLIDNYHRAYIVGVKGDVKIFLILNRYGIAFCTPDKLQEQVMDWLRLHLHEENDADIEEKIQNASFDQEALARASLLPKELSQRMDGWLRRELKDTSDEFWRDHRDFAYANILPEAYDALLPEFLADVLPASRLSINDDKIILRYPDSDPCQRLPLTTDLQVDETGKLIFEAASDGPYLLRRLPRAEFARTGVFRSQPLDSGKAGNPWHRVALELNVPERTGVRLYGLTSEVLRPELKATDLLEDPPKVEPWQAAPDNADEWLIQSPPGRYLYLALVLKGPGDRTPVIKHIYVYGKRQSSLRYLPSAFQNEETSHHLLDRLLSLFDTVYAEIETRIEDFPLLLDPEGATQDFLPWLASWFDLSIERNWTEKQKRTFLKKIIELYRWRGTIKGIKLLLQLHTGLEPPLPQIVEHFRSASNPALTTWLGEPSESDPFQHFSVLLPGFTIDTPEKRKIVERLVDANKPAHTHFTLRPVFPAFRLGSASAFGSALGLDSMIGRHEAWHLPAENETNAILGGRTVLPQVPIPRAIAVRLGYTRLGIPILGCKSCPSCEKLQGELKI